MKVRLALAAGLAIAFVLALGASTILRLTPELLGARAVLTGRAGALDQGGLGRARAHLERALAVLGSWSAAPLHALPVAGANLDALELVLTPLERSLAAAQQLDRRRTELLDTGIMDGRRVDLRAISSLQTPLQRGARSLQAVAAAARDARSGWLLPPLWDELDELEARSHTLARTLGDAAVLAGAADELLGVHGPRRYLIVLLNNAELRGAGGVLTGVGTLTAAGGELSLGRFEPYEALGRPRATAVVSPPDFARYEGFGANTSLWINTSMSPDAADVARVAADLYERVRGVTTDGVILADPRGLASLLDPGARLRLPGLGVTLQAKELPELVYARAYELFTSGRARHRAILELGKRAFERALADGLSGERLEAVGAAVAEGHLRFVSFDAGTAEALARLGISGSLTPATRDVVLVAVQNYGGGRPGMGSKLDYWTERHVGHRCRVAGDGGARCETTVELTNHTPRGLSSYVAGRPYGLLRSYVELYVPSQARLTAVEVDGTPAAYRPEPAEGLLSVGVYLEVARGATSGAAVRYELPSNPGGYSLTLLPQPLARDAHLRVEIEYPAGMTVRGATKSGAGRALVTGTFTRRALITVARPARSGLAALWSGLARFWTEPLL